ncbi:MAG TPA: prepilin-type N-terminal cleavage/methylation domain-containing protein [Thermoanaerobaculia bacterium]|nr:prepilin-type N-terminal cleavage/methylation domain-containing protein [Thermoanaerobaculia bacterium]
MSTSAHRGERGFNLIEVLIAMAMLSTVLLAVVTLFFMGRRNVYSGRQMTRATSVVVNAGEDLSALTAREIFEAFTIPANETKGNRTIAGVNYTNAIFRSTTDTSKDNTADGYAYLARWKALLPAERVSGGRVTLVILPSQQADAADVTTARVLRVRVITEWTEATRARHVFSDTVKFNRRLGV